MSMYNLVRTIFYETANSFLPPKFNTKWPPTPPWRGRWLPKRCLFLKCPPTHPWMEHRGTGGFEVAGGGF